MTPTACLDCYWYVRVVVVEVDRSTNVEVKGDRELQSLSCKKSDNVAAFSKRSMQVSTLSCNMTIHKEENLSLLMVYF